MPTLNNMYFEIVKTVLDESIDFHGTENKIPLEQIYQEISQHIATTSGEHRNPDPNINYSDALCRLGYLFSHVGANACLFERTLQNSKLLLSLEKKVTVCAVGGGPGTELLGLIKCLITNQIALAEIDFTILDNVSAWSDTWDFMAIESEKYFAQFGLPKPVIHRKFNAVDAVLPENYKPYSRLFSTIDIVVYNYLVSVNQVRFEKFADAFKEMITRTKSGCFFIIIDRLEENLFTKIDGLFQDQRLKRIYTEKIKGCIDDYESALGDYPRFFDRRPRRWLQYSNEYPKAFAIVAQKI